jgi:GT2 family glycosyltransferase
VLLETDFVSALIAAAPTDKRIVTVCGKIADAEGRLRIPTSNVWIPPAFTLTRCCGIWIAEARKSTYGHYLKPEYVFGATAAAALYRRKMIRTSRLGGEFFDTDFFVYREDADVAWRAQLLGWKCLYTPLARGYHVRSVLPGNRRALPAEINMHSVKNRFLMRIKNITPGVYWRNFLSITFRDAIVLTACLLHEHSSLRAFPFLIRNFSRFLAKRRQIMARRRVSDEYMEAWFSYQPVALRPPKLSKVPTRVLARYRGTPSR